MGTENQDRDVVDAINNDRCVLCKGHVDTEEDFRDDISREEYQLSGMCQSCQDDVFSG